jgi:hypothetical protein
MHKIYISQLIFIIMWMFLAFNTLSQESSFIFKDSSKTDIKKAESFFNDFYCICQKDTGYQWNTNI